MTRITAQATQTRVRLGGASQAPFNNGMSINDPWRERANAKPLIIKRTHNDNPTPIRATT